MVAPGVASLTLGYRGAVALRVTATTASSDLHSGSYGGSVANAAGVMAGLVAGLHTAGGAVAAPGFYDGLPPAPLRAAEAAQLAAVPFDEAADLARVGARGGWGEPGFGALARRWLRPTAEVVGMWSGWTGDGTKTVLPAVAAATVVARTVPGQDGDAVFQSLRSHLLSSAARGPYAGLADVSVARLGFASEPYSADAGAAVSRAAAEALAAVYGAQPLLVRSGGSIAALPLFRRLLGADTASLAFGHGGNGAHAPNEHSARPRDLYQT